MHFLGIHIDETLDWNCHIDKIYYKTSRYFGILSKLKYYLLMFILKTLYNSLIVPNSIWNFCVNKFITYVLYKKKKLSTIYGAQVGRFLLWGTVIIQRFPHRKCLLFAKCKSLNCLLIAESNICERGP